MPSQDRLDGSITFACTLVVIRLCQLLTVVILSPLALLVSIAVKLRVPGARKVHHLVARVLVRFLPR